MPVALAHGGQTKNISGGFPVLPDIAVFSHDTRWPLRDSLILLLWSPCHHYRHFHEQVHRAVDDDGDEKEVRRRDVPRKANTRD